MALIQCPECGKQISDRAPACIHCGFPLSELMNSNTKELNISSKDNYTIQLIDYGNKKAKVVSIIKEYRDISSKEILELLKVLPANVAFDMPKEIAIRIAQDFINNDIIFKAYKGTEVTEFNLKKDPFASMPGKMISCPRCSKKISEHSRSCQYCGFDGIAAYLINQERKKSVRPTTADYSVQNTYVQSNRVTCPYCKSVNVTKITTGKRALSVELFGLASGKVGKQWHCNNCKSDF